MSNSQTSTVNEAPLKAVFLEAGDYYIGDPSYVLSQEDYADMLHQAYGPDFTKEQNYAVIRGRKMFLSSTFYGDGIYYDEEDYCYYVDSGQIACIPVDLIVQEDYDSNHATLNEFVEDFECVPCDRNTEDGRIIMGDAVIDTNEDEDD